MDEGQHGIYTQRITFIGLVSNAQQNLIIKYTDIRTFLNHYLPRRIGTDIQSLIQGLEPDSAIIRAVTRIGR